MSYPLTILDGKTSLPIQGAAVFVVYTSTGNASNLISDANGRVNLDAGLAAITVTASGYVTQKLSYVTNQIAMVPAVTSGSLITFHVFPQEDQTNSSSVALSNGATLTFTGSSGSESLHVNSTGNTTTAKTYPPGTYTVSVSQVGYLPINQQIVLLPGQTDIVLSLVSTSTVATPIVAAPAESPGPTPSGSNKSAAIISSETYEYIYPNSVDGKYFQASQARMYIGNQFVDELVLCQWMVAENKIPIYGYRSSKFDAVGRGHSLVQGQLAINLVSEGYMYVLLQEFKKKITSNIGTYISGVPTPLQDQINSLVQQRALLLVNHGDTSSIDSLLVTAGRSSSAAAGYVSTALKSGSLSNLASPIGSTGSHKNAVYLDIPFDIVVNFEGAGRIVTRRLTNCFLGANDFNFSHDGKTLLDSYSFIARDVT